MRCLKFLFAVRNFLNIFESEIRGYFSQKENLPILEDLCNVIHFRLGTVMWYLLLSDFMSEMFKELKFIVHSLLLTTKYTIST